MSNDHSLSQPMAPSPDRPAPGVEQDRVWGEHPAHRTCIDVSAIDQRPGAEWICGPECPR